MFDTFKYSIKKQKVDMKAKYWHCVKITQLSHQTTFYTMNKSNGKRTCANTYVICSLMKVTRECSRCFKEGLMVKIGWLDNEEICALTTAKT